MDQTRSSAAPVVALAARAQKSSMSPTQTWIRGTCEETAKKFDVSEEDCVQVSVVRDSCRISGTKYPCRFGRSMTQV
ncbi:BQ5605_C017g08516 [Microbotryum silenes-dioicae]|uniref:BQ5605_C017g08516 protein n=1 Tax=Microbotryum silenes-dioicae TaxID=796604 RepID=A0A2X0LYX6_9BASI|nr:BQ5605_C017g08516 [Microbotryum silenes-dioicae]